MARILLIEDDENWVLSMCAVLERAGHELGVAPTFTAGLEAFQAEAWDAVLFDPGLPNETRERVILAMSAIENKVPVGMMTAGDASANRGTSMMKVTTKTDISRSAAMLQFVDDLLASAPTRQPGQGG